MSFTLTCTNCVFIVTEKAWFESIETGWKQHGNTHSFLTIGNLTVLALA